MASHARVLNVTRGYWIKYRHALRGIYEEFSIDWVEEGISVRDLTLAESIAKRNAQEKLITEPLGFAELPGVVFRPPSNATASHQASQELAEMARQFFKDAQLQAALARGRRPPQTRSAKPGRKQPLNLAGLACPCRGGLCWPCLAGRLVLLKHEASF